MTHTVWPRSLLGIPLAAAMFALTSAPVLSLFGQWPQYLPCGFLYPTLIGIGGEAVLGHVPLAWLCLPVVIAGLSVLPRWRERKHVETERLQIAQVDDCGFGPGAFGLPITLDRLETAQSLVRRYDIPLVYAPKELVSVDYVAVTLAGDVLNITPIGQEPSGTLTLYSTASPFQRGLLEGVDFVLRVDWPSGFSRSRRSVQIDRVGIPA